jgi:hypothetical protein
MMTPSEEKQILTLNERSKGDLLYMLGEMGRRQSIALLQSVLADKYSAEVKEAAREALDKVKSRIVKK